MKLYKKHVGKCFDCRGSDGSWFYVLLDVKKDKLLFISGQVGGKYILDTNDYSDWQYYVPRAWTSLNKAETKQAWIAAEATKR